MPAASSSSADRERARRLVLAHGWNVAAYQILNPGMRLWFAEAGDAVAGYVAHAGAWVVAGAPVCAEPRLPTVAAELEASARRAGARVIYFGAGTRLERLYAPQGTHHLLLLGAQPSWDAREWPAIVAGKSSLRAQLNRARNKGVSVREWPWREAEGSPALRRVLADWLGTRGLPPLHFMTEPEMLGDLRDRRVFVAERGARPVAFLLATPVPARQGWLVEQWPRTREAPNGTTHLLVDAAMRALAADGARYVSLGLAPLSDRAGAIGAGEPAWLRLLLRWLRAHGRRFYNFAGLDAFKASLAPPAWEPVYAITPSRRVGQGDLRGIAAAFGGGSPVRLVATAFAMAVAREARVVGGRVRKSF